MKILFAFLIMVICQHAQLNAQKNATSALEERTTATSPAFDVQGHRGCRGLMPENTIPAFLKALDLDVNTLEMDTQISKDQQVVISHDPYFIPEITLTPQGNAITYSDEKNLVLYTMNYSLIKTYDVGFKYYPAFPQQEKIKTYKPLLSDVIDSTELHARKLGRTKPLFYNIEIKSAVAYDGKYYASLPRYIDQVIAVIQQKHISSRVIIESFDVRALRYIHTHYPTYKLALDADASDSLSFATRISQLGFSPNMLCININVITGRLISDCAAKGIKLIPYVANNLNDMKLMKSMGANGFMTDYPNLAKQL